MIGSRCHRSRIWGSLGLSLAVAVACRSTMPEPSERPTTTADAVAATSVEHRPASLEQRLDAMAVTGDDFVRTELYTWTTPAQIEALRAGGRLLVADAGEDPSPFNRLLLAMVNERRLGHEVAALLEHGPGLTRRRYAWPNPFATVLGKGPRTYGEALIRVELSPHTIVARLDPTATPPWSFRDATGAVVSQDEVMREPLRLGAVYHLRVDANESIPFRELVLCNETMVARFSVGTPEIAERIEQERQLMRELAAGPFAQLSSPMLAWRAWPQWTEPASDPPLLSRWHQTLAFDNVRYRPSLRALARIDEALGDYDPTGPAFVGGRAIHASQ